MKVENVKVKKIKDTEIIKDTDFQKRSFVVTKDPDGEYPTDINFELHNAKVSLADEFAVGDIVTVNFSISARYYEPKDEYFNTVKAWNVEVIEKAVEPF